VLVGEPQKLEGGEEAIDSSSLSERSLARTTAL
jgi:hypothetical protein